MVDNITTVITGGVSGLWTNISNDAYLIIIAGQNKDQYSVSQYDKTLANKSQNFLDKTLSTSAVGKAVLSGVTSPIAQNLASKALPNAVLGRINSSLYDIMADGKISIKEVAEDFVGSCTNTLDNVATNMGFPTPSSLYSAVMPSGTGVISKDFVNLFSKKNQSENDLADKKANEDTGLTIIKLKLVSSDNENLSIEIPTRKTEKNFNIATSINNSNATRKFEALIVHDDNKNVNMYDVKNKLKQIRDAKEYVDVYISDKDVQESEMILDCLMSDLSFDISNKNAISCSIEFTKVPEWNIFIDATLDKSLNSGATNNTGKKAKKTNDKLQNKPSVVKSIKNFEVGSNSAYANIKSRVENAQYYKNQGDTDKYNKEINTITERLNSSDIKANQGHKFSKSEVQNIIENGGTVIKK